MHFACPWQVRVTEVQAELSGLDVSLVLYWGLSHRAVYVSPPVL